MGTELEIGALFAGRFRVEERLGSGGIATVYRARHEVLARPVALKLLHARLLGDLEILRRFEREARAASRIEHPRITRIFDFGHTEEGVPYLAMEYAAGPNLAEVLERDGPLALTRALDVLWQIAEALGAAHAAQVIHRDLKPSNVVLVSDPLQGEQVKVLDFGLAKILEPGDGPSLSADGLRFGTPQYMSPQQITGEPLDQRTDVYSFGVMTFELLVGQVPFSGALPEILDGHLNETPVPPSLASGRTDLPSALDGLVLRCLAKQPDERYADGRALTAELQALRNKT